MVRPPSSPARDHKRSLPAWFNSKPEVYQSEMDLIGADRWIDRQYVLIVPSEVDDATLDWFLDRAEAAAVQHNAKVLVVDPWNEMDHRRLPVKSLTEYTGRAIKVFKRFAKKFLVAVVIVTHPAKQHKDQDGNVKVPTLYDILDSARWYNKADAGLIVHRVDNQTIIRVAKSRYHVEIGIPGEVHANFSSHGRRFAILSDDE